MFSNHKREIIFFIAWVEEIIACVECRSFPLGPFVAPEAVSCSVLFSDGQHHMRIDGITVEITTRE